MFLDIKNDSTPANKQKGILSIHIVTLLAYVFRITRKTTNKAKRITQLSMPK